MADQLAQRPGIPEAVHDTLHEFSTEMGLTIRAWQQVDGSPVLVFPSSEDDSAPSGDGFSLEPRDGPVLDVEIEGNGKGSPLARLLAASLARTYELAQEIDFFTYELSERYEEINLLYSISETLGSILKLDEASGLILQEVSDVLGARRGSLWVHRPEEGLLRLAAAVGEGKLRRSIRVDDETSISARVFRDGRPIIALGDQVDGIDLGDMTLRHGDSWLAVPVRFTPQSGDTRTVGVVNLIGRRRGGRFTASDQKLLAAIASQIGAALENNRLIQESLARERVSREMELANDLQMKLLPPVPQIPRVEAAARVVPAESVGGDFYQVLQLSGGRVGVMIGDVSGHGFPAALIMALVMSAAAIYAEEGATPAKVLEYVDRAIGDELESTEMYLSLFYCVLSPEEARIVYSNAGHPHAFVVGKDGPPERLLATDPPMGIGAAPYGESTAAWAPGRDLLFLFTEGLSDSLAEMHRGSGESLLLQTVRDLRDEPAQEILERLFDMLGQAIPSMPSDDRTAVVLRTT
ncbi:MAG: PP2C family protein-serine/threonine phosphatase [Longimicrobiales bacterium]